MTDRDDWFLEHIDSYSALFLGLRSNLANGDKVIGTNPTLPHQKGRVLYRRALDCQAPENLQLSTDHQG